MPTRRRILFALFLAAAPGLLLGARCGRAARLLRQEGPAPAGLVRREWSIDGVPREGLLAVPDAARTAPTPVVFAFHGHGGGMRNAARSFGFHRAWPEAIVVYLQGLPTPGRLTDPQGLRNGWQARPGDQGDRDLKFFDTVLASLKKDYKVDERRIYCTGHSNGGGFTYQLWAVRGDVFAAVAPCAAVGPPEMRNAKPKPVMHVAGEMDPLVKFEWQKRQIDQVKLLNGCGEGTMWAPLCTLFASKGGTPVVTMIHPGGHTFPREAPELIVRFFKENPKP